MRILICAGEAPVEPLNGFRLQLHRLVSGLGKRHEVTVLALLPSGGALPEPEWGELVAVSLDGRGLVARVRPSLSALAGRRPRAAARGVPPMASAAQRVLAERRFDVAQVSGPSLAEAAAAFGPLPSVLSALDAWHLNVAADARVAPPWQRPVYRLEERNVRRYCAREFVRFERVVVVSGADARALADLNPSLNVEVVPNGVDVDELRPNPEVPREPGLVVFTGALQWAPNADAARFLASEVFPLLRTRVPHARLAIVGRNPGPKVTALARLEGVEVTGEVPDIRPWLWRAAAYACPMVSGTGIKNKLLEALACATPCVATAHACQGIAIVPGRDLLVADSAPQLANALAEVMGDPELQRRLGSRGRDAVGAGHSWEAVVREHERIYEAALEAGPGSPVQPRIAAQ